MIRLFCCVDICTFTSPCPEPDRFAAFSAFGAVRLAAVELVERVMTDVTAAEDKKIQAEILDEFAKGSTVVNASCFGFAWFGCFRWLEVRRIGKSARQEKSRSLRLCKPLAEKRRSWASNTSDEAEAEARRWFRASETSC